MPEISADDQQAGDIESISAAEVCDGAEVVVQDVILLARDKADDLIVGDVRAENDRRPLSETEPLMLTPSKRSGAEVFRVFDDLMGERL